MFFENMLKEKNDLFTELQNERGNNSNVEDRMQKVVSQKADLEAQIKELENRLSEEEHQAGDLSERKKKLESELKNYF